MPTCTRRLWEDDAPTARAAPQLFSSIAAISAAGTTLSQQPSDSKDLQSAKAAARRAAVARRQGHDPVACGQALAGHLLRECPPTPEAIVACFWPMGDEIDLRCLMHTLHERGNSVVLPVTPRRGEALTFRRWRPGDVLVPERFGTLRPIGATLTPDFLLIPLLAFDATGGRLGYGGGFYDRTLSGLPGRFRLGCGFAAQQVDAVPVGPYDRRLDAVATEQGIVRVLKAGVELGPASN